MPTENRGRRRKQMGRSRKRPLLDRVLRLKLHLFPQVGSKNRGCHWESRSGSVIPPISDTSPDSRAWSAAGGAVMPIILPLHNPVRLDAKYQTNSRSPFVLDITESCTIAGTRGIGGANTKSSRRRPLGNSGCDRPASPHEFRYYRPAPADGHGTIHTAIPPDAGERASLTESPRKAPRSVIPIVRSR